MTQAKSLKELREAIDALDGELLALISRRARIAQQIALAKNGAPQAAPPGVPNPQASWSEKSKPESDHPAAHPIAYYRPDREALVLRRVVEANPGPLASAHVARIFQEIMSACLAVQKAIRVGYWDRAVPWGAEVFQHFGHGVRAQPFSQPVEAMAALQGGDLDYALVPMHAWRGPLSLSALRHSELRVCGETYCAERLLVMGHESIAPTGRDRTAVLISHPKVSPRASGAAPAPVAELARVEVVDTIHENELQLLLVEGHPADEALAAGVHAIERSGGEVVVLGSYPRPLSGQFASDQSPSEGGGSLEG